MSVFRVESRSKHLLNPPLVCGEVTRQEGEIPIDLEVSRGQRFLFISYDQSALSHGLHKYPAKFFPELPRWLILRYSQEGDWGLDPFAGSATVNIEALLSRRHSAAIDVDPFARFLARVKVTPLNVKGLLDARAWLKEKIALYQAGGRELPEFPYRDNWFQSFILEELAFVKSSILALTDGPLAGLARSEAENTRDFFLVCFSSIIRAVSNADDHCTRTVVRKRLNKPIRPGMALARFGKVMDIATPRMAAFSEECPLDISVEIPQNGDARSLPYPDGYFHLAITSPPYVNAVDYPRTHQLEIYWLGMENGSLRHLKRQHIGTEVVLSEEYRELGRTGLPEVDTLLARLFESDPRRSFILYKYLKDMEDNLREVRRVLQPGGRYVMAVGNNRMRGHVVESWRYLMEIAESVGYRVETYFASEIIRHFIKVPREERIGTDWVIVLRR
ncbi:MAG: DNA methyltransferase [Dehalococcoidia bacterium]|nr:DNA methyltransferase [Dehalococcoidia bacterium]